MNEMNNESTDDNEWDERLDAAIESIRNSPVPPVPTIKTPLAAVPSESQSHPVASQRRWWLFLAIAASLLFAMTWINWPDSGAERDPKGRSVAEHRPSAVSTVVRSSTALTEPLDALLTQLDRLEAELTEMQRTSDLLDARQQAERLVADFTPIPEAF